MHSEEGSRLIDISLIQGATYRYIIHITHLTLIPFKVLTNHVTRRDQGWPMKVVIKGVDDG